MLFAGAILLVLSVVAVFVARHERGKARKATATETLSCGDVAALSAGVAAEVEAGLFSQRCEAVGKAQPGPTGLVPAPESKADAVWVRTKVTHKYWEIVETRRDGRTHRDRQEREETVSDLTSDAAFVLADDTGTVAIHPSGAEIDRPERVVDRFEPHSGGDDHGGGLLGTLLKATKDSGTLGFQHEEWIIRPGTALYVQGEVADRSGALAFAAPKDEGAFLVSTRSEEEIVGEAERNAKIAVAAAVGAAVLGVVLLVAGAVA